VISSAAQRCVSTVRPYATLAGVAIETQPAFTVSPAGDAAPTWMLPAREQIEELAEAAAPAVICAHRENLPLLLAWACARLAAKAPDGPPLAKGGCWVLHIGDGMVVSTERHHPSAV
jgi:8-oxo-dGTP diphosphatase